MLMSISNPREMASGGTVTLFPVIPMM